MGEAIVVMLRVTEPTPEEMHDLKVLLTSYGAWLYGREIGGETEKAHIHAVFHTTKKIQAVRTRIARMFNNAGNAKYSMKVSLDPDAACRYACKERDCEAYGAWSMSCKDFADAYDSAGAEKRSVAKRKTNWLEEVIATCREKEYDYDSDKLKIFRLVHAAVPCPNKYSVQNAMYKIRRAFLSESSADRMWALLEIDL